MEWVLRVQADEGYMINASYIREWIRENRQVIFLLLTVRQKPS